VVAVDIDFICADDIHHSLCPRGIRIAHGSSKERPCRLLPRSRSFRIYHLRGFDSLCQEANPSIDLPQSSLAVLIVGVFTAIAIARSPRHHLHHGRAILGEQKMALIFQAFDPAWSNVVFSVVRRGLLCFRSSRKPFSHPAALS
jgi:hypothetical protein